MNSIKLHEGVDKLKSMETPALRNLMYTYKIVDAQTWQKCGRPPFHWALKPCQFCSIPFLQVKSTPEDNSAK